MSKAEKKSTPSRAPAPVRQFEPTNMQCVLILSALVFVFFHKIILGQAYFWEDFIYQNYPFRTFAATSLASGELPLWNPYTFNGMPFLADIQTTVLYIPCLLLTLFVSNGSLNYYWLELMIILHFVLAGVGMFYLAKSFKLNNIPALFAAVAYMLSGYMIVHAIHQQNVTLVAWYPLVVLLFRKALSEQRWLYVFVCGLVLGHSILAGYPQLSLYLYMFLGLYLLLELLTTFKGNQLLSRPALVMSAKAASIVAISVAIAMIQLLPTFELSDLSDRAQITFEKSAEGSLAWSQLATLFFPKMFGVAGASGYEYFGPGQYFYYWETCIYLGILPLLLAVVSFILRKNKHVAFLLGLSVFSILFALGDNFFLYKIFHEFIPGFSTFRIPARMGILLTLSAALLSAFSLQYLLYQSKSDRERKLLRNALLVASGLGILLYFLITSGSFSGSIAGASYQQVASLISQGVTPSILLLLTSAGILFGIVMKGNLTRFAALLLTGLLFVDMFVFGGSQNNGAMNPAEYFNRRSDLALFFKKEGEKELFRVNTRNARGMLPGWDRNQGMMDRIFMMEGYTPLALERKYAPYGSAEQSLDLLNVKYKTVFDEQSGQQTLVEHTTRLPRTFFVYEVHVARTDQDVLASIKSPEFNHRTTAVLEKEPSRPLSELHVQPESEARITDYSNNRISISARTSHPGILVLSEIYYPGWKAYVDGVETEIYRTNYHLRSVFVEAGNHVVEIRFEPSTFSNGAWISGGTLLLCIAGILFSRRKRRDDTVESAS
ncbi:MAG: YfhO family protein [Bacteroidetes bacterium]|nr:YfhO family protein [Bacteroidota bacterium]MCW5895861.1 YfhO family protein [Bacteroidota bacterium]